MDGWLHGVPVGLAAIPVVLVAISVLLVCLLGTKKLTLKDFTRKVGKQNAPIVNVVYPFCAKFHTKSALAGLASITPVFTLEFRPGRFRKWITEVCFQDGDVYGADAEKVYTNALLLLEASLWGLMADLPEGTVFQLNGKEPDWMTHWLKAIEFGLKSPTDIRPGWTY